MLYSRRTAIFSILLAFSLFLMGFYAYAYLVLENSDPILYGLTITSAVICFVACAALLSNYHSSDKPFAIWLNFSIGLFLWMSAEIVWAFISLQTGEAPHLGLADIFWVVGMLFFTEGMRRQYRLVTQTSLAWWAIPLFWAAVALLTVVVVFLVGSPLIIDNYMEYFYAVADFALGLLAVRLLLFFNGGVFSRPWVGMFVFGISDSLYAVAYASGLYSFSAETGNPISLVVDVTYIAAYLALALGFFSQYLLLRLGPSAFFKPAKN